MFDRSRKTNTSVSRCVLLMLTDDLLVIFSSVQMFERGRKAI